MKKINNMQRKNVGKIKQSEHIFAVKVKTESNGLGALKTLLVIFLIAVQAGILVSSYLFFLVFFQWYLTLSIVLTFISCIHVLSSNYHGQAKATWILFMLVCFSFGFVMYWLSDKRIMFSKSKKKYAKIFKQTANLQTQIKFNCGLDKQVKSNCNYLYNSGKFVSHTNCKAEYFSSGASLFDDIIENIKKAKDFIFIEFFIVSDGVLFERVFKILKQKAQDGVDVRIIYDDMGSHGTLKRKTKKAIVNAGIKLQCFNRLVPVFNIALNLRDHRKIVVIDGKIAYTGGTNFADEYINEKRMHGYWKDCGIKLEGSATDNLTIAFLTQWQFLTNQKINYNNYINKEIKKFENSAIFVPFVSGPHYDFSIAQNMYANLIGDAKEKLWIMSPYFIADETITNLLVNKARSGVDVRIILPGVADKKFVYVVSRNNAEKLLKYGVKVYTMTHSFVHSKLVLTENMAIIGSINVDLRSFNQQFESAVFTNDQYVLNQINADFEKTFEYSCEITEKNQKRNSLFYRIFAGVFNLVSPFM